MAEKNHIAQFIKDQRNAAGLTQEELALKAGVGLRFIREVEQGKTTLKMDKVNQVLELFGYQLTPGNQLDPYQIYRDFMNRPIKMLLKNKVSLVGMLLGPIRENNEIIAWEFVANNDAIAYKTNNNRDLIKKIQHKDIEKVENI